MTLDFPDLFQVNEVNCDAWTFVRLRLCQTSHKIRCIQLSMAALLLGRTHCTLRLQPLDYCCGGDDDDDDMGFYSLYLDTPHST